MSRARLLWYPDGHWLLFGMLVGALLAALLSQGYDRHEVGVSSTVANGTPVASLAGAGPLLDLSGTSVRSLRPPAGAVALTFDDGPDPTWTPKVLAVLGRFHVPATFFVVGSQVLAHPALLRRELAAGDDVGSHTFTHADLGAVSGTRANLELSLTETALAGAGGINAALLRLPYSSTPAGLTVEQLRAAKDAARFGYLVVLATNDSQDWRRPGVDRIIANAVRAAGDGAVVMFHDGGGDRAQTVAALERLIPMLAARGDRFETVAALAGQRHSQVDPPISLGPHLQGVGLMWGMSLALVLTAVLTWLLVPVAVLAALRTVLVLLLARRHRRATPPPGEHSPAVSVVVPAYNEEVGIAATVRSLAASHYPQFEIIVVDDGSTDATSEQVTSLGLPMVTVLRQANGGKAAALNTGVGHARHDVIVMVDGDTVFEPDTLACLVRPLADPTVGAVSGNTKVGNRRRLLGRWQHIEYVQGFNLDRRLYDVLRCMPTVPGAIGAFRREALASVGGISTDTLAEDTDLTMALHRRGWRVVYEDSARAWTEAPASLRALWAQRYRWSYGTMQAMWKHRAAFGEGGPLGRVGLPYLTLFQVVLPLLAPVIDLFAVYGLLFLNPGPVLGYWLGFNALQVVVAAYAFRLDGESLRPLATVPLQQFVYRQLMYLVVIQSVISAATGARLGWNKLIRHGGIEPAVPDQPLAGDQA
ncbi:MAG TPA: bifunctional polysaccharide deacetylase/glycosyltransferase family 2 protein [Acidimicrobiales bacterium]|nr:bifunctional polysaccharide deacetylase/glycosyltransferase family 2 protein [Acidimicrobiales bacterium]